MLLIQYSAHMSIFRQKIFHSINLNNFRKFFNINTQLRMFKTLETKIENLSKNLRKRDIILHELA